MRDTLIIIFIILAIIGGGIFTNKYINNTADEITEKLKKLKDDTIIAKDTENRTYIKEEIENIDKQWKKTSNIWSTIVIHQEIDNIENAMIKAKSSIENGNLEDALQEIETTLFFINHVKDREKISLKNIF